MDIQRSPKRRKVPIIIVAAFLAGGSSFLLLRPAPVLIGAVLPIGTSLGNEENLFLRYYQAAHPRLGGRRVSFLVENPPSTKAEVWDACRRLDAMGVSAILGGVLSMDGAWLADYALGSGIPAFGLTSSSELLSGRQDSFFRLCPGNDSQARTVARYYELHNCRRLLVVASTENDAYVEAYRQTLEASFHGKLTSLSFSGDDLVSRTIAAEHPQSVFAILPAKDLIRLIKVVRESGRAMPIGSSSWGSIEILSLYSGPLLDGVQFFSLDTAVKGDAFKAELSDFEKKYSMQATNGSCYEVSILKMLGDAISAVGPSRSALKAWFETPRSYDTAYGTMAMDSYGDNATSRDEVLQVSDGSMQKIETVKVDP